MDLKTKNELIKQLKIDFINDTMCEIDPKFRKTVESWKRSRKAGAAYSRSSLTSEHRDLLVFERIDDISKCHLAYLQDYYESRNTLLENMGGAIFYLDTELVAFHKGGNKELLEELKKKGIRIGTKFSVENVGVFAGNLAIEKPFVNCFTVGEAHFCDILTSYACIARYGQTTSANGFHAVNLIFVPLNKCYKNTINSAAFILEAGDFTYKTRMLYPHMERRFRLLEQSAQYSTDIMLLVDEKGGIIFVNSRFENEFQIHVVDIIGKSLRQQFPNLSFVLKALRSGKEISSSNIPIAARTGYSKTYYVECLPIFDEKKIMGLKVSIKTAEQIRRYSAATERYNAVYSFQDIIAESSGMIKVKNIAKSAAASPANVLIMGESGTGKELFAQSIHNASSRFNSPFIPVNCGTFSNEFAGTALLGSDGIAGKLASADGGTLFLDNISEMSSEMQSFIMRFIEDGLVTPASSSDPIHVDVRIIASANSELIRKVELGEFRLDLYYRINVLNIVLPPLRERVADIPKLSNAFVTQLSVKYDKNIYSVAPETLAMFKKYSWPGNLRELKNVIERSLITAENNQALSVQDFEDQLRMDVMLKSNTRSAISSQDIIDAEKNRIVETLVRYNGNKAKTARALGMSRGTLYKRLKTL